MKILIVEDNPLIAQAIEQTGEDLQMKIDRASDGWDAIEKLETEEYAAIVIDADMPRHSGYGVLTFLREEVGELDNVIVMTSDREEARRKISGDVKVIGKSDSHSELEKAVRLCCNEVVSE